MSPTPRDFWPHVPTALCVAGIIVANHLGDQVFVNDLFGAAILCEVAAGIYGRQESGDDPPRIASISGTSATATRSFGTVTLSGPGAFRSDVMPRLRARDYPAARGPSVAAAVSGSSATLASHVGLTGIGATGSAMTATLSASTDDRWARAIRNA